MQCINRCKPLKDRVPPVETKQKTIFPMRGAGWVIQMQKKVSKEEKRIIFQQKKTILYAWSYSFLLCNNVNEGRYIYI